MPIVSILYNVRFFRLSCSVPAAGLVVFLFCSPLWGSISDDDPQHPLVWFSNDCKGQLVDDHLNRFDGCLAKRRSRDQHFQRWQDLSPAEQEKMREKYREWQSLPPEEQQIIRRRLNQLNKMPAQKRRLYKQLFRQWQHLSPKERRKIQNDLNNWENLSPQQRNSIRRRFKN